MASGWDPFLVLWLDHDPHPRDRQVRRAYGARLLWTWRIRDDWRRAVEARRIMVAYRALRTAARRHQVVSDLTVQPGARRAFYIRPGVRAMADAALPPLLGGWYGFTAACDLRALEREAAALRLERAEAGVLPWPHTRLGRAWWRARHGSPG